MKVNKERTRSEYEKIVKKNVPMKMMVYTIIMLVSGFLLLVINNNFGVNSIYLSILAFFLSVVFFVKFLNARKRESNYLDKVYECKSGEKVHSN